MSADQLPQPKGPYSTTRQVGDVLYLSGQGSVDVATGEPVLDDIASQTRRTLENVEALLRAHGFGLEDLVQVTCHLRHMSELSEMNRAYADYFGTRTGPVRTTIQAGDLPFGLSLEMTCVAHRESGAGVAASPSEV